MSTNIEFIIGKNTSGKTKHLSEKYFENINKLISKSEIVQEFEKWDFFFKYNCFLGESFYFEMD